MQQLLVPRMHAVHWNWVSLPIDAQPETHGVAVVTPAMNSSAQHAQVCVHLHAEASTLGTAHACTCDAGTGNAVAGSAVAGGCHAALASLYLQPQHEEHSPVLQSQVQQLMAKVIGHVEQQKRHQALRYPSAVDAPMKPLDAAAVAALVAAAGAARTQIGQLPAANVVASVVYMAMADGVYAAGAKARLAWTDAVAGAAKLRPAAAEA